MRYDDVKWLLRSDRLSATPKKIERASARKLMLLIIMPHYS